MPKEHPKMYQKVVNMAPTWAQVGAMLGSKIVLDTSKSEEKTTPKKTSKNINPPPPLRARTGPAPGRVPPLKLPPLAHFVRLLEDDELQRSATVDKPTERFPVFFHVCFRPPF